MTATKACPDFTALVALLDDGDVRPDPAVVAHLEHCDSCQRQLETLAADTSYWATAPALLATESAEEEPGLRRTLEKLSGAGHETPTALLADREILEALEPTAAPGHLGRIGHYEIASVLGQGGMGVVLQARDTTLDRTVAIKVLAPVLARNPAARQRFTREARIAAAVRDDHIVSIHAVDEFQGLPYLVMDHIPGGALQERLALEGPLPIVEVVRLGMEIAQGLAAAHALGLVHRDIKPANILLDGPTSRAKIADFGLARVGDDASLTQSGVVAGTPSYMAPEQARAEPVDQRADLFGLGGVMYAMCTGRPPFHAEATLALLKKVCEQPHRPVREINADVPAWLEQIIDKLLAKEPSDRFQTAAEVAELLRGYGAHLREPHGVPAPRWTSSPAARRRRPWRVVAAAALLVAIALGITEATGVTHLAVTIIRIVVPDGTLIIEVNDPKINVTIEGDGGVRITGAGPQEIRLRPGDYRLEASKDGKLVHKELVNIRRGDKTTVAVRIEPAAVAIANAPLHADLVRLTAVLERNPTDLQARLERAQTLARLQRLDDALADYSKVIELAPEQREFSGAYVGRAEIRTLRGDWEAAVADYEARRKLTQNPKDRFADGRIAQIRLYAPAPHGDAEKALQVFEQIMKTNPRDHGYRTTLGVAYYRLDRFADAVATLEHAATLPPGPNSYDQFALALAYSKTGQAEKARGCHQKAKQMWTLTAQRMGNQMFVLEALRTEAAALLEPKAKENLK